MEVYHGLPHCAGLRYTATTKKKGEVVSARESRFPYFTYSLCALQSCRGETSAVACLDHSPLRMPGSSFERTWVKNNSHRQSNYTEELAYRYVDM
jgi:hypothetical protein